MRLTVIVSAHPILENFLQSTVGPLEDLEPALAFTAPFSSLDLPAPLPPVWSRIDRHAVAQRYEEVLGFQTYDSRQAQLVSSFL